MNKVGSIVWPAADLARILANHGFLRLVLLNTCEGARGSELDIYSSMAAILVRRGIAAVLAMHVQRSLTGPPSSFPVSSMKPWLADCP